MTDAGEDTAPGDPWGGGDSAIDPWSAAAATGSGTTPASQRPAGTQPTALSPEAAPRAGRAWGGFQAGKAQAPEASWKDTPKSGRPWGGARGKWSSSNSGPSGPDLPRKRVSTAKVEGKVIEWKGKYGWIQPNQPVRHPKAPQRQGRIFVSKTDIGEGLWELAPNTLCTFHVFEDEAGLGAEDVVIVRGAGGGPPPMSTMRQTVGRGGDRLSQGGRGGRGGCGCCSGGRGGGRHPDSMPNSEFSLPGYEQLHVGGPSAPPRQSEGNACGLGKGAGHLVAPGGESTFNLPAYTPMQPAQPLGSSGYGTLPHMGSPMPLADSHLVARSNAGLGLVPVDGCLGGFSMPGFMDVLGQGGKGGAQHGVLAGGGPSPCPLPAYPGFSMPTPGLGAPYPRPPGAGLTPGVQGWGTPFLPSRPPSSMALQGSFSSRA